jgi:hypothetical protein
MAGLKSRDITLVETTTWAFLHQAALLRGEGTLRPWIRWKQLAIISKAENWSGIPGSRLLTPEELDSVGEVVFREGRPAPIRTPTEPTDGETATIKYFVRLMAYRLGGGRPESVIGILGVVGGTSRLVYGELRERGYEILWDSPLFPGSMLKMGLEDVDGDGMKEILLQSAYGLNLDAWTLSVFNIRGQELTRQPECFAEGDWGYDKRGGICPIAAESFTLEDPRDGKRDIVVGGRYEDLGLVEYRKLHRYSLRDGRYVYVGEVKEDDQSDADIEVGRHRRVFALREERKDLLVVAMTAERIREALRMGNMVPDTVRQEDLWAARDALDYGWAGYHFLGGGGMAFTTPFSRVVAAAVGTPERIGVAKLEQVKPEWLAPELHVHVPSIKEPSTVTRVIAVFITPLGAEDPTRVVYPIRTEPMHESVRGLMGWTEEGSAVTAVFPLSVLSEANEAHIVYDAFASACRGHRCVAPFDLRGVR